jgi:hypothetical protein
MGSPRNHAASNQHARTLQGLHGNVQRLIYKALPPSGRAGLAQTSKHYMEDPNLQTLVNMNKLRAAAARVLQAFARGRASMVSFLPAAGGVVVPSRKVRDFIRGRPDPLERNQLRSTPWGSATGRRGQYGRYRTNSAHYFPRSRGGVLSPQIEAASNVRNTRLNAARRKAMIENAMRKSKAASTIQVAARRRRRLAGRLAGA